MGSKKSLRSSSGIFDGDEDGTKPYFIYGGPFIEVKKPDPFLDIATPINIQLQGTFKKSFAYYSLKERMPVILTKIIDQLSKQGGSGSQEVLKRISKLKSELVTNKKYELLEGTSEDAKKWNTYINNSPDSYYFTNIWVFTECYIYRKLRDFCEVTKGMHDFDPFETQKEMAFQSNLVPICMVAEKVLAMMNKSEKDKRKADFITLLKLCLWSNKCDLSLSMGEEVKNATDPLQMIIDFKDKLLIDDTNKISDQVCAKSEALAAKIKAAAPAKKCSCERLAVLAGVPISKEEAPPAPPPAAEEKKEGEAAPPPPEPEKPPCPVKMLVPQTVIFDIVCDNAGYELFTDLCLADFIISQEIAAKVRFHVKKIPWFISDVTPKDFTYVINSCAKTQFSAKVEIEVKPEVKKDKDKGEPAPPPPPPEPVTVTSEQLKQLGARWKQYHDNGTFIVMCDDFWTSPHTYKDMKKYDPNLYRKLQFALAIVFKGDLNYRKLLGERNCNPYLGFEPALQGFIPAPIIALRTVKADLICGLGKGKFEATNKIDPKWMEKGDFGVIQFCGKAEPLKPGDRPCMDYGDECHGVVCPKHTDI